jgi:hypothetical protein
LEPNTAEGEHSFKVITLLPEIYQKKRGLSSRNELRNNGKSRYYHLYHGILKNPREEAVAVVEASRALHQKSAFHVTSLSSKKGGVAH